MPGEDAVELTLSAGDVLNPALLEEPGADHLDGEAQVDFGKIEIRIGSRPIATDLGRLYAETGRTIPPEYSATFDGFRLWMIEFHIGILRQGGIKRLESVSVEVRFPESPRITITDLFPRPQFIDRMKADASGHFVAKPTIDRSKER